MSNRSLYLLGAAIGGTAGSFAPGLWGASDFSFQAVMLSTIGALLGVWLMHRYVAS